AEEDHSLPLDEVVAKARAGRQETEGGVDDPAELGEREVHAEAVVRAVAEDREVVRVALEVEAVGIGEDTRVAVRAREREHEHLALPDLLAAELEVSQRIAREAGAAAEAVAQDLVHRGRDEAPIGAEARERVGMLEERA